jgi:predicted Zn-dependent protease
MGVSDYDPAILLILELHGKGRSILPALLILIIVLILLFNPNLLGGLGSWLGGHSRKPYRQAKWVWSSFAGTEDESILAERDYGQECARVFAKQFLGSVSGTDQEFAASIGTRLADAVKDPRREFHVTVVSAPFANAFALPGGFVFITQPLLNLCNHDRNEIAFFLGHEIAHILRGHAKDHMTANTFLNAVMSRLPVAGQMLREVVGKGYSRTLELEADQEAVRLTAAAGFDAGASIHALKRLTQISPDTSGLMEYLSSHPPISERIRELEHSIKG